MISCFEGLIFRESCVTYPGHENGRDDDIKYSIAPYDDMYETVKEVSPNYHK